MACKAKKNKYDNYVLKFSHALVRKTNIQINLDKKLDGYQVIIQFFSLFNLPIQNTNIVTN